MTNMVLLMLCALLGAGVGAQVRSLLQQEFAAPFHHLSDMDAFCCPAMEAHGAEWATRNSEICNGI